MQSRTIDEVLGADGMVAGLYDQFIFALFDLNNFFTLKDLMMRVFRKQTSQFFTDLPIVDDATFWNMNGTYSRCIGLDFP